MNYPQFASPELWVFTSLSSLEGLDKPESSGFNKTSKGYIRLVLDVMGKIVTVVEALLLESLLTMITGRRLSISDPTAGLRFAKYISPRFISESIPYG